MKRSRELVFLTKSALVYKALASTSTYSVLPLQNEAVRALPVFN